jgi:hypothetical protein
MKMPRAMELGTSHHVPDSADSSFNGLTRVIADGELDGWQTKRHSNREW